MLIVFFNLKKPNGNEKAEAIMDLIEESHPLRNKLSYKIMNKIVVPFLGSTFLICFWPIGLYMKIREVFNSKDVLEIEEDEEFSVKEGDLLERLSQQEIEDRELVYDPLNAVPELPFGHLNMAWCNFLNQISDGDELWSFTAKWKTEWSRGEYLSGYVIVNGGNPATHFLTMSRLIVDEK